MFEIFIGFCLFLAMDLTWDDYTCPNNVVNLVWSNDGEQANENPIDTWDDQLKDVDATVDDNEASILVNVDEP